MDQTIQNFLEDSSVAKKVKVKGKIILQRMKLTANDIIKMKQNKSYGAIPKKEQICELEIGNQVLAKGKIVRKKGEYYFKVTHINE